MADSTDRKFEYLLNAMESAAQSPSPAKEDYAGKRRAVFAYVERLERIERLCADLSDIGRDAEMVANAIRELRHAIRTARG